MTGEERRVLLLGSGMVSPAFINVILADPKNKVTIGAYLMDEAEMRRANCSDPKRVTVEKCDVSNNADLERLIPGHHVVCSLVPAPMHPVVAKVCIKHKVHLATASYRSPAMLELDAEAKQAGVIIMNEFGLDPGMDHLSAVTTIRAMERKGAKCVSFESWCGGLPAPESSNNPLGYKFSWNPRGVLRAAGNPCSYLYDGKEVNISGAEVMKNGVKPIEFGPDFEKLGVKFECYPNRNSAQYLDFYNLKDAKTCLRGTVRYAGFCHLVDTWKKIGIFNEDPLAELAPENKDSITWPQIMAKVLHCTATDATSLKNATKATWKKVGIVYTAEEEAKSMADYEWFGIYDEKTPVIKRGTIIDTFCALLEEKLKLEATDRDLVILQHRFKFQLADGKTEKRTATCISYGEKGGHSAMARTVGIPLAVVAQMILDGKVKQRGSICPYDEELGLMALKELEEKHDIKFVEEVVQ